MGECGADVAAEGAARHFEGFVSPFEDDDILLALERGNNGSLGEGTDDIDVDGADLDTLGFAEVVDGGFDVFSGGAERDEDSVGVVTLVLRDEAVVVAGELAEVLVSFFEELQDRFGEVVAARDDAVHVVFLILHRTEEDGVRQIHHLGHAAAGGSKENALRFRRAVDDVFRRAEVFADQFRLVLVEGALKVAGEEAIHDVHAGRERELGNAAEDEGLVGGLLGASLPKIMIQLVSRAP